MPRSFPGNGSDSLQALHLPTPEQMLESYLVFLRRCTLSLVRPVAAAGGIAFRLVGVHHPLLLFAPPESSRDRREPFRGAPHSGRIAGTGTRMRPGHAHLYRFPPTGRGGTGRPGRRLLPASAGRPGTVPAPEPVVPLNPGHCPPADYRNDFSTTCAGTWTAVKRVHEKRNDNFRARSER
jgi:hypothetical protein